MDETIYLCLDLEPKVGVVVKAIDPAATVAELLVTDITQGPNFVRNWCCFKTLEAANAYQKERPTLIVIPLVTADIIPFAELH